MTDKSPARTRRIVATATAVVTALATVATIGIVSATSPSTQASARAETTVPQSTPLALTDTVPAQPSAGPTPDPSAPASASATVPEPAAIGDIKNVVLLLADDLDWALFNEVPRLADLKGKGITFTNFTVTDSLCCPSRTSIMRSQYIHNHHVISNTYATGGGWPTFKRLGEQLDCLPTWLTKSGHKTALIGKYLNEWPTSMASARSVPAGWSEWQVPINHAAPYFGYDYTLNSNGRLVTYGRKPSDFLSDVLTRKSLDYIRTAPDGFFLEIAPFTPHMPAAVALRNKGSHAGSAVPRTPDYNTHGVNPPNWSRRFNTLSPTREATLDRLWRKRAESAEGFADTVTSVMNTLRLDGRDKDTLVIVTSDNGYHMGAHGLFRGKRTAYHQDTVVPMIAIGPGIPSGVAVDGMTSTVDLAPTIAEVLKTPVPAWTDGRSLVPLLTTGATPGDWRTAVLTESDGISTKDDPDYTPQDPPPYKALRTQDWLYVVYRDGEEELYNRKADPYEINNVIGTTDATTVNSLHSQLQALAGCSGPTCRTADSYPQPEG